MSIWCERSDPIGPLRLAWHEQYPGASPVKAQAAGMPCSWCLFGGPVLGSEEGGVCEVGALRARARSLRRLLW